MNCQNCNQTFEQTDLEQVLCEACETSRLEEETETEVKIYSEHWSWI